MWRTHWKRSWYWEDWRQEEKGMTEDKTVGWHHRLDGYEFEQASGIGEGQESLVCCSPWGHKEWDLSEQLNWTDSWLKISTVFSWTNCLHRALSLYLFTIQLHMTFSLTWNIYIFLYIFNYVMKPWISFRIQHKHQFFSKSLLIHQGGSCLYLFLYIYWW